jgi:MFS family permease
MSTINPVKAENPAKYTVVIGAFITLVSLGLVLASFGVFFKPLSNEFGWTRGDTSGAYSTAMIVSGLMAIVSGRLADRFSPRLVITILGVLLGFSFLLLSQTSNLFQLFLYYGIIAGCGMSVMIPTTSLITRIYQRGRGLMTGITLSGASIGSMIAAPFLASLINTFNWRISYIISGVIILIFITLSLVLLHDPPKENASSNPKNAKPDVNTPRNLDGTFQGAFVSGRFWILGTVLFCVGFTQSMLVVHIIPHATDMGFLPLEAAAILSVMFVACIAGNFAAGKTNDILGGSLSMIIFLSAMAISLAVLMIGGPLWVLFVMAALVGIGFGGAVTLRSLLVAELFGLKSHGVITGAIMLIFTIGSAIGPMIAGYTFDITNQYQTVFILTGGICIIGLVMACILKLKFSGSKIG